MLRLATSACKNYVCNDDLSIHQSSVTIAFGRTGHISGDAKLKSSLCQNGRLCSWVSTWHQVWGQVEIGIANLLFAMMKRMCLPPCKGNKDISGTSFEEPKSSFIVLWPFPSFNGMEVAGNPVNSSVPPHCKCLHLIKHNKRIDSVHSSLVV